MKTTPVWFRPWAILTVILAQSAVFEFSYPAHAQTPASAVSGVEHWIPTWVAAPQQGRPVPIRVPQAAAAAQPQTATQAPVAARPAGPTVSFNNQTVRMVVHTSIGGRRVRVQLSNAYGGAPLQIGSAHIAIRAKDSAIVSGSDRALTFSGKPTFSIPAGAVVVSDPVNLDVPQSGQLFVSVYVPGDTGPATLHSVGLHTTYISKEGDLAGAAEFADASTSQSWYWLSSVEVSVSANVAAVITFGDSITDGTRSTPNTDSSWPSFLAGRLLSNPGTSHIAVLNEGISGNRILRDGIGPAGLARFDRDVLTQPGVKWITILEGINDIGAGIGEAFVYGPRPNSPASENPTPDDLIGAYRQMIERAHNHEIKVIGCTLLPFEGAPYYSESGNTVRQAVNQWIRTSGAFDAVIDFDVLMRSPANPNGIRPEFDSGDHLHPNDAGYKAMAGAIDLSIFGRPSVVTKN
jgi:lysophospholipase L1-like esterase